MRSVSESSLFFRSDPISDAPHMTLPRTAVIVFEGECISAMCLTVSVRSQKVILALPSEVIARSMYDVFSDI